MSIWQALRLASNALSYFLTCPSAPRFFVRNQLRNRLTHNAGSHFEHLALVFLVFYDLHLLT